MRIQKKQLLSLRAITQSGVFVGRVGDITLDSASHLIEYYHVSAGSNLRKLLFTSSPLKIPRQAVIAITNEELIVEDAVVAELRDTRKTRIGKRVVTQAVHPRG